MVAKYVFSVLSGRHGASYRRECGSDDSETEWEQYGCAGSPGHRRGLGLAAAAPQGSLERHVCGKSSDRNTTSTSMYIILYTVFLNDKFM